MMISVHPAATASSTPYWISGLSTSGSISLGVALVAGRKRVPMPAAGKTALRIDGCAMSEASGPCGEDEKRNLVMLSSNGGHAITTFASGPSGRAVAIP